MNKLRNYLHLYIGADVQYPDTDGKLVVATLTGVSRTDGVETTYKKRRGKGHVVGDYLAWEENGNHNCNALNIKLILRPLSSITEDEVKELLETCFNEKCIEIYKSEEAGFPHKVEKNGRPIWSVYDPLSFRYKPQEAHFLLTHGFDLFGLIGDGLALDKTTFKAKKYAR